MGLAVAPTRADLPPTHYRGSRLVSVWLPYWTNLNGTSIGWRSIQAHAQDLDEVSFFSWGVDSATGDLKPPARGIDADPLLWQVAWLHTRDVAAIFTVTLFGKVHETLNNQAVLDRLTAEIVRTAEVNDFDGVDIDFEEFRPEDAQDSDRYTSFIENVAKAMHEQRDTNGFPKQVIATILAKTQRGKFGFSDEESIAKSDVDRIRVMAYDDYYPGSKTAGACAPLAWTKNVASFLAGLDCPHEKFILGIPGYGYQWPVKSVSDRTTTGKGLSVTYPQAQSLIGTAHATTIWDDTSQTQAIAYVKPQTGQTWLGFYEDARSWEAKLDQTLLPFPLGGICEWAAGFEDPAAWPMIERKLATPYPIYGAIGQCYARCGGGQVLGAPLGPPTGWGASDNRLPLGREGIEQRFERGRISYRWGERNAHWVKE